MVKLTPSTLPTVPGVTNVVTSYDPTDYISGAPNGPSDLATAVTAGLSATASAAEKFAYMLFFKPKNIVFPRGVAHKSPYGEMTGLTFRPTTVLELVSRMPDNERKALIAAVDGATESNIVEILQGSSDLVSHLKSLGPVASASAFAFTPPSIGSVINNPGLHLLLANPMVSTVVMAQRKLQTQAAAARVIPVPSGFPFGALGPGAGGLNITVSQRGGAELDPIHPIEMRGAGHMIAAMKGGFGPFFLGTASSPTSWRPVDDNSFISASLEQALASLKSTLQGTGTSLESKTDTDIQQLITNLKEAEKQVRKSRDALNDMNKAIASGTADHKGKGEISMEVVQKTADAYNQSMKMRQKLENKLFRVVIALGGKVIHP